MQGTRIVATLVTAAVLALPAWASADVQRFEIAKDGESRAMFVSEAMLETIKGISSELHGSVKFDPNDLSSVEGELKIPADSMKTGIELRNEHLKSEKWLHAEKYPYITFEITGVQGASRLEPGQTKRLKVEGKISVHGVTKPVTADVRAKHMPDEGVLRARAKFKLKLDQFNIDIPTAVRLKVSNEITIKIDLRGVAQ
jgi:polyisoprenoid-binding protein YceI